ncbi:Piso0_001828 [Millerozyma farinosa CBS 7064]|uniref:Piso0_001828 protein n=1 Tax=Pichia sorbitophila (strain ATCC MYA-4447 / BCRC 22081 / CBS 7064 / NBRC 10061 / NRRL Y-12695) TaxID=559304 RepID=G8YLU6_PICSO|nr:Piso0_001828 [Millerozyma farinosa CBS 7064]
MTVKKRGSEGSKSSSKRQNKSKGNESSPKLFSLDEIEVLGDEIMETKKYNNFIPLLEQFSLIKKRLLVSEDEEYEKTGRKASLVLFRSFEALHKQGLLTTKKNYDENKKLVVKWLIQKYNQFKDIISDFIVSKLSYESSLQIDLLEIGLNLVKVEYVNTSSNPDNLHFPSQTYRQVVEAILQSKNGRVVSDGSSDNFLVLEFVDRFSKYWDLQYYFVNGLGDVLEEWKAQKPQDELRTIFANFYSIMRNELLFQRGDLEDLDVWVGRPLPSLAYKPGNFKSQFQKTFVTILSYPLTTSQYKSILLILHKRIIPYLAQPQCLMDFLTDAYDTGDDIIPILTLNSLYELMKTYNLEYPEFYTKLYTLLTPGLMYTRYRSRFFRLCDLFLSSTHLSAKLVASFIKRLARLSLSSSASGVVIIIPFIYNLMKRHPSCMIMLHNPDGAKTAGFEDPFKPSEQNPLKTDAIASSLWELETLMSHYHPNIATLARMFKEPFRKPSYNMEDFFDWSYISLLESERKRRFKTSVAIEFDEWDHLFANSAQPSEEATASSSYLSGWSL